MGYRRLCPLRAEINIHCIHTVATLPVKITLALQKAKREYFPQIF